MVTIEKAAGELVACIRAEYAEMPGLCLTKQQIRRLWSLNTDVCDAVVDELIASGFLRCLSGNSFVRVK